jgi:hypothetical protein
MSWKTSVKMITGSAAGTCSQLAFAGRLRPPPSATADTSIVNSKPVAIAIDRVHFISFFLKLAKRAFGSTSSPCHIGF